MGDCGVSATPGLLKLLAWFSPTMPTGAFSYSHELEWAVEAALVHDASSLRGYLHAVLRHGSGRLDAGFLAAAYRASIDGTFERLLLEEVISLGAVMHGTRELALESAAQGRALLTTLRQAWPAPELEELDALCRRPGVEPRHACVAGVAAAAHRMPLQGAILAFLHALAANLISAGIRLIPLGQTDGQRLTATLAPAILEVTDEALASTSTTSAPRHPWSNGARCAMRPSTRGCFAHETSCVNLPLVARVAGAGGHHQGRFAPAVPVACGDP
jgi:urease accessory protein